MTTWAPVGHHRYTGASDEQTTARYEEIAREVIAVASDPEEEPLFEGPDGRARTAVFLAYWASQESGEYRADVATGRRRGDHDRSVCLMQVQPRSGTISRRSTRASA